MPESLDAFSELRAIRARVEGIEHRQEMLVRAHADEILEAVWRCIDADQSLAQVYLLVDGERTQQGIVAELQKRGLALSQPTVSRKLTKLNVELGLVEVGDRDAAGIVYVKSDLDRILHLTPKVERRLAELQRGKPKSKQT
jgi:DNA-binding transcriptional ArsR family regulator